LSFAESDLEEVLIAWLHDEGWSYVPGPTLAPDGEAPERASWDDVLLRERLREALTRLNPDAPPEAVDDAFRKVTVLPGTTTETMNQAFHRFVADGIPVEYINAEGRVQGDRLRLFDTATIEENDWLVVNQITIIDGQFHRRPDVILYVNGLPLVLIELKKLGDENATVRGAFNQLRTYRNELPNVFAWNELLVISDGDQARLGTTTSEFERFMPWKTIDGTKEHSGHGQLEVLAHGVFDRARFLDLISCFVVFEVDGALAVKKLAAYHQYWAVNKAVDATIDASSTDGDKRIGVVWHTQGSGKSLSMVFYAGKLVRDPRMRNPTLLVLTDRNDLDDQLFGAFALAEGLLPAPRQAEDRGDLKDLLRVASGGVIFATVQKFGVKKGESTPVLSDRRNIVVITDEAHRSQYDFDDGFAHNIRAALPNASFIGFTGTPIETGDRITRSVFGDYIDIYDIAQAVEDGATVPIYYEGRLVELDIDPKERAELDNQVSDVTEAEEESSKRRVQSKWARMEALVGTENRLRQIAQDLLEHFAHRTDAMPGKGMVVGMSRRICAGLYAQIITLRPDWHSDNDAEGGIKVVITGSASDDQQLQPHIRNKLRNKAIQARLKDPGDPLRLVIVRDMWLTGFDAPVLHTMYIDKPMKGHGLMQAIARVNRVFKDKPGGLVVDYLGLGNEFRRAIRDYTDSKGRGDVAIDLELAVQALQEKLEVVRGMLHGFDYAGALSDDPQAKWKAAVGALDLITSEEDRRDRFLAGTRDLLKAFRLAGSSPYALQRRDEVAYFLGLRSSLLKITPEGRVSPQDLDLAMGQILSRAVIADGVVDIFKAAGIDRPDISLVSDEFLEEVARLPQRNLAAAALEKLLRDELKVRRKSNIVEARKFSEMLDTTMRKYHNRAIEAAQIVLELVAMAKEFREMANRGHKLNLTDPELAFYDALAANGSAKELMGDDMLAAIARELASKIRNSATVDWAVKESVKAQLRVDVKRLLRKYKYPPDQQEAATRLVLEQAVALADMWA
jgi:type I restriction enzyme R subunit